jgi:hypothetical protein
MTSPFKTANKVIMEALNDSKRSEKEPKQTMPKKAYPNHRDTNKRMHVKTLLTQKDQRSTTLCIYLPSIIGITPTINLATRGTPRFNVATKM